MAHRRPLLQLGVALGPQLEQRVLPAIVQFDAADGLGVAAIEALREPEDGGERADGAAAVAREGAQHPMTLLRGGAAVIARDERDGFDFVRLEAAQIAVADEIFGVLVMAFVADVHADVVEQGRVLQPLALPVGQAMHRARLVEQGRRQPRDLLGVLRPVAAALGELDNAPTPDVRIPIGLRDLLAMPGDVVEDDALA